MSDGPERMAAVRWDSVSDGVSAERMAAARRAIADARRAAPNLQQRQRTSKDNEEYAKDFFSASRLHFIGSWKARFELICDTLPPAPPLPAVAPGCERVVLHIDMDCFFASVAAALRPELAGLPLAVSWGEASSTHAEIASASYEARAKGVRNGMWIPQALRCCPELLVAPYEFGEYEKAAEAMYRVVFSVTPHVMGVSVDECYADVTGLGDPAALASSLRARIRDATKCNASIGIGPNRVVARLATAQAKPNGMRALSGKEARELLWDLPVRTLPGIGHTTSTKLEQAGIVTCGDLGTADAETARAAIGAKLATRLQGFACGRDDRPWESRPVRKSVGAQASWGVRFALASEAEHFVHQLAGEVASRLAAGKLRGRSVTLKVWRAMAGVPAWAVKGEMGHGMCDNLSRTLSLEQFTCSATRIGHEGCKMLRELAVPPADVRGMGLAVGKLEGRPGSSSALGRATLARVAPAPPQTPFAWDRMPTWWKEKSGISAPEHVCGPPNPPARPTDAAPGGGKTCAGSTGGARADSSVKRLGGSPHGSPRKVARLDDWAVAPPAVCGRESPAAVWGTDAGGSSSAAPTSNQPLLPSSAVAVADSPAHALPVGAALSPDGISLLASADPLPDGICPDSGMYMSMAADALTEHLRSAFLEASLPHPAMPRPHSLRRQLEALIASLTGGVEALLRMGGGSSTSMAAARSLVREGAALGRRSLSADPTRHAICAGEGTLAAWLEACDEMEEGISVFARRLAGCPRRGGLGRGQLTDHNYISAD